MKKFVHNYSKFLHNEIYEISIKLIHHYAKISYYCYELEKLINNNNRYLTFEIISRLDRYDNYNEFKLIEYLDPYLSIPTNNQSHYLKIKLIKLLKLFLKYKF